MIARQAGPCGTNSHHRFNKKDLKEEDVPKTALYSEYVVGLSPDSRPELPRRVKGVIIRSHAEAEEDPRAYIDAIVYPTGGIMKSISEIVRDRPLYAASPDMSVEEAARYMAENKIGAVPVLSDDRLVGIFSERDVVTRVIARGLDPKQAKVKDVMTTKIVVAQADESINSCLTKMQQAHCRHLPVVSGDDLIGIVSLRDLLQIDLDEKERNLEYLESYIYTIPPGTAKRYKDQ